LNVSALYFELFRTVFGHASPFPTKTGMIVKMV